MRTREKWKLPLKRPRSAREFRKGTLCSCKKINEQAVNWTYVTYTARFAIIITGIPFVMRRMIFQITTMGIPSVMTTVVRSPVHPPIITSSIIPIFPISILDHSFAFSTMYNPYFNSWARQRKEISRFFSKILTILLLHAVSYAYFCEDIFRLRRIFFDFSANISHIYPEDLVVLISVWSPHIMEKSGVGNDLA